MAIVNLDRVQATKVGNLESVIFSQDVTNGVFFHLGDLKAGLISGDGEVYGAITPTTASIETDELLLHASPELTYDPRQQGLKGFTLNEGEAGRGYHLTAGDTFTLTADLITGAPEAGKFVVPQNGSMKLDVADAKGTTRFVGKIEEKTTLGFDGAEAYVIKVLQA